MALKVKAIADEAMHYVRIVGKCEDVTFNENVLELYKNDSSGCSFIVSIPIPLLRKTTELTESIRMMIKSAFKGEGVFPTWFTMKWTDGAGVVDEDVVVVGGPLR